LWRVGKRTAIPEVRGMRTIGEKGVLRGENVHTGHDKEKRGAAKTREF